MTQEHEASPPPAVAARSSPTARTERVEEGLWVAANDHAATLAGTVHEARPGEPKPRQLPLRPKDVIHLQRTVGNRVVAQRLARRSRASLPKAPASGGGMPIQRKSPFSASWEATQQGFKVTGSFTPEKEIPAGYGKIVVSAPISVSGELKAKDQSPVTVGGGGKSDGTKSAKATVEVYKAEAAAGAAKSLPEMALASIESGRWKVATVEWDVLEGETGEGSTGSTISIATGVKFTFENGQSTVVKATLFEKQAGAGLAGKEEMSGPSVEFEHTIPLVDKLLWSNDSAELKGKGDVKAKLALKPDWKKVFAELAKQGGRTVAANFLRSAMSGIVKGLLGAGGFVAGGVVTLAAAYKMMESISAIKEARGAAQSAYYGYVRGWCQGWGVTEYGSDGSPGYFAEGKAQATAKLKEKIAEIQRHPVFEPFAFTEEELWGTLTEKLSQHPSEVWEASGASQHPQEPSALRDKIYTDITIAFYNKRKNEFFTFEYIARKEARDLARGLGLPDLAERFSQPDSAIPEVS